MDYLPTKRDLQALRHDQREVIRLLILDPWLRLTAAFVVLVALGLTLLLPKFWRVTPPGFRPQIRVSLLNLAQAWRLKRSAEQLAAAGAAEEAAAAWRAAVSRNLADVATLRQTLRATLSLPEVSPAVLDRVAALPAWLLALGGTNAQDVGLVARLLDRAGCPDEVYLLLHPIADQLSPEDEVLYLKALLDREELAAYAARWERAAVDIAKDPTLALYHTAYLAACGSLPVREDARRRLAQAAREPAESILATRLQLVDYAQSQSIEDYASALARLVEARADRLREHLRLWELLVQAGRVDDARTRAAQETPRPRNAGEVIVLSKALFELGLRGQAHKLMRLCSLRQEGIGLTSAQVVWQERAALLAAAADWRGLLEMVEDLQASPGNLTAMGGWVDFIEGQAHHNLGHSGLALTAMEAAARKSFPSPHIAFEVGVGLKQMGYLEPACQVLSPLENEFAQEPLYWETVFQLAEALRQDAVLLLKAAREARRLHPGDARWDFSYAASLLVNRLDPAAAVTLTREFLDRYPDSPQVRVNHSHALAFNQRYEEAAAMLASIDPNRFEAFGQTAFHLCALEIHLGQRNLARARQDIAGIRREHLFPNQVRWLDQTLRAAGLDDGGEDSGATGRP